MEIGHWSKFSLAANCHSEVSNRASEQYRKQCKSLCEMLSISQKFYFPDSAHVLNGKEFDSSIRDLIKLPFDAVAVLSESAIRQTDGSSQPAMRITLAFSPNSLTGLSSPIVNANLIKPDEIVLTSFMKPRWSSWKWFGIICHVKPIGERGYQIGAFDTDVARSARTHGVDPSLELRDDWDSIANLCVMLALQNVRGIKVNVPEKLTQKRERNRKLPLYDYHVLEVDGDIWNSVESGAEGDGFRSHLRRGHIRRLDEHRRVWVRATFVKGSIPGFVNKEYKLRSPQ